MRTKIILISLVTVVVLMACDKEEEHFEDTNIIGYWINPQESDSVSIFEKSKSLNDDGYGFVIKQDGKFIERKNSGFCGTPPISYGDFEGSWTQNDSILNITVDFWGGKVDYKWQLIEANEKKLVIVRLEEDYHWDDIK